MDAFNSPILPAETFLVYQFALVTVAPDRLQQKMVKVGEYTSAEEALEVARENAIAVATVHAEAVTSTPGEKEPADPAISILPTEWGYDVKREFLTLARFWVHSRAFH